MYSHLFQIIFLIQIIFRVNLRVTTMYFSLRRAPEKETHDFLQFSIILRIPLFLGKSYSLVGDTLSVFLSTLNERPRYNTMVSKLTKQSIISEVISVLTTFFAYMTLCKTKLTFVGIYFNLFLRDDLWYKQTQNSERWEFPISSFFQNIKKVQSCKTEDNLSSYR